jgi:uncharacterized damage-inducible protein DinB
LSDDDLGRKIRYRTLSNPADIEQVLSPALDHFFNHQTHHRGQATAVITKHGEDVGDTDLWLVVPEEIFAPL